MLFARSKSPGVVSRRLGRCRDEMLQGSRVAGHVTSTSVSSKLKATSSCSTCTQSSPGTVRVLCALGDANGSGPLTLRR